MKVVGIIAEYNPFHNGHKYHIEKSKEITKADFVIVIMSGAFTQQGNIAIYDKFNRSKIAVECGADLVIELPAIYASSSSEYFAKSAISILDSLNIVDYISFGSETGNIEVLKSIANTITQNEESLWKKIKIELKKGYSFATARQNTLVEYLNDEEQQEISKPNNILGIEYIKWLIKLDSSIIPITLKREDSGFNSKNISKHDVFASATSIRNSIYKNEDIKNLDKYVPDLTFNLINNTKPSFNDSIYTLLKYKITTLGKDKLSNINEITEGLENKIYNSINISNNYNEFIHNVKSKRYQMSKIKRALVNILLNITKDDFKFIDDNFSPYAHVLSLSSNGKLLLSEISKRSNITLLTNFNDDKLNNMNEYIHKSIQIDILAQNIHSIINNNNINKDYTNKL